MRGDPSRATAPPARQLGRPAGCSRAGVESRFDQGIMSLLPSLATSQSKRGVESRFDLDRRATPRLRSSVRASRRAPGRWSAPSDPWSVSVPGPVGLAGPARLLNAGQHRAGDAPQVTRRAPMRWRPSPVPIRGIRAIRGEDSAPPRGRRHSPGSDRRTGSLVVGSGPSFLFQVPSPFLFDGSTLATAAPRADGASEVFLWAATSSDCVPSGEIGKIATIARGNWLARAS